MASEELSILELEDAANRVRARLGVTLDRLRHNLTPAHLLDEWADSSGLKEMTPEKIFTFAARRHPVPTMLIGASLGFLAYSAASRTKTNSRELDLTPNATDGGDRDHPPRKIGDMIGALADSATEVFRERVDAKREELVNAAKSHVTVGAKHLSDVVESKLDDLLTQIPGPWAARPIVAATAQLLLVAALQAVLRKSPKR
jgi:hypothetical protein